MSRMHYLLSEYQKSHMNPTNKMIHLFCVPIIFWTIYGLLFYVPLGLSGYENLANVAVLISIPISIYYFRLSVKWGLTMIAIFAVCWLTVNQLSFVLESPVSNYLGLFVLAWIGQFIGHKIEGAKPSFFDDLQFLLIGPMWVGMQLTGQTLESLKGEEKGKRVIN